MRTRFDGMLRTFRLDPDDFQGWAVARPVDAACTRLVEPAGPAAIAAYLRPLKRLRLRLARKLGRHPGCDRASRATHSAEGTGEARFPASWLAYPVNDAEARRRLDRAMPLPIVHLAERAARFDVVVARWDGQCLWYEEADGRLDPADADRLNDALRNDESPDDLAWKGLTPCLHVGLAAGFAEVLWDEQYRVPSPAQDDVCDYPLARTLVLMTVAVAAEAIIDYTATHGKRGYTITQADLAVRSFH